VGGIELWGHRDAGLPLPLAGRASLWSGLSKALLWFDLALGRNLESYQPNSYSQSWGDESKGPFLRLGLVSSESDSLAKRLADGASDGHLEVEPSREVALRTHRFARYFGKSLSIPVVVEIVSVAGKW